MPHWYHVTPLFLFPNIVDQKGLLCGADVESDELPRRESSRTFDDIQIAGLDGKRVADFILLFQQRKPMNSLLLNKICGNRHGGSWRCYPHIVLRFDSEKCLAMLDKPIFGVSANIGRSLRSGIEPNFLRYEKADEMATDKVQEILVLAESLPQRTLSLTSLDSIEVFSNSDMQLVQAMLNRSIFSEVQVALSNAVQRVSDYTAGQLSEPGLRYLQLHQELFAAIDEGDQTRRLNLIKRLACECFD